MPMVGRKICNTAVKLVEVARVTNRLRVGYSLGRWNTCDGTYDCKCCLERASRMKMNAREVVDLSTELQRIAICGAGWTLPKFPPAGVSGQWLVP